MNANNQTPSKNENQESNTPHTYPPFDKPSDDLPQFKRLLADMLEDELEAELSNCREDLTQKIAQFRAMDEKPPHELKFGERRKVTDLFWKAYDNMHAVEEEVYKRAQVEKLAALGAEFKKGVAVWLEGSEEFMESIANAQKLAQAEDHDRQARDLTELLSVARQQMLSLAGSLNTDGRWNPAGYGYEDTIQTAKFAVDKLVAAWEKLGDALLWVQEASGHIWRIKIELDVEEGGDDNEPPF